MLQLEFLNSEHGRANISHLLWSISHKTMSGSLAGVNIHREMTKKFKAACGASSPSNRNSSIRVLTGLSNCQFPSISYSEGYLRPESTIILSFPPQQMMMELGKQRRVASDMVHIPHTARTRRLPGTLWPSPSRGKKHHRVSDTMCFYTSVQSSAWLRWIQC